MVASFITMSAPNYTRIAPCLYRETRSGTYYALVKHGGRQVRRSLRTQDRRVADVELASFRHKLVSGQPVASRSFLEVGREWLESVRGRLKAASYRRYRQCVEFIAAQVGNSPVDRLDFSRFVDARESSSASTYNKDVMVIRAVMGFAVRRQWASVAPPLRLRRVKPLRPEVPTKTQLQSILEHIRGRQDLRAREAGRMVELMALSGMRLHEASQLLWDEIDLAKGEFRVTGGAYGTKNGESRVVPLFPSLRQFLEGLPRKTGRVVLVKNPRKPFLTACRKLGLPLFRRHALRAYFITQAIEAGIDFATIAQWVGHSDGGVLVAKVYGRVHPDHSRRMADRL
jgi:integrase